MILKIIGVTLLSAFAAFILKGLSWRAAPVFACLAAIVILAMMGEGMSKVFEAVLGFSLNSDVNDAVSVIIKIIGIGYLFGISADICRELGEGTIAKALEVAGRVEIIAFVIPYFIKIMNLGVQLIEG